MFRAEGDMMDRQRIFWLAALLGASLAAAPVNADYVGGLNPAGDNFLALRTGPGSRFPMILPMGPGTFLTVIGRNGRWLNVELEDGTRGWAYDAYIVGGAAPDDGPVDEPSNSVAAEPPPPARVSPDEPAADIGAEAPSTSADVRPGDTKTPATLSAGTTADPAASNWITYRNDRFGTRIDYSAPFFEMLPPPENDDGRSFEARDGSARFMVFASHNVFDSSLDELIEENLAGLGEGEKVTQKRRGENWYLHSGFRGDDFFLRKVLLSDAGAVIHTFEISYAKSLKAKLDPVAARMAQSLRAGDESVESKSEKPKTNASGLQGAPFAGATDDDGNALSVTVGQGWRSHDLDGFALKAPGDWKASVDGDTLVLKAPDGKRSLMVWWWFPDEPLLGYSDIVSNHKIKVAGEPALWIHSKFEGVETLSVTLDEGRADKKRLHFLFEATGGLRLGGGEPDFDRILQSVTIDGPEGKSGAEDSGQPLIVPRPDGEEPVPPNATTEDAATADEVTADEGGAEDEERRAWVGRTSVTVPSGWKVGPDENIAGGIVMTRPDEGAQIALSLWPEDRPMPSAEVTSLDYTVMLGRPATVLELSEGRMRARQIFFDEPRGGGARLTLAYRAFGEELGDGLPLFEMVLASLDETFAPPKDVESPVVAPAAGSDPFADIDLSDLEVNPR